MFSVDLHGLCCSIIDLYWSLLDFIGIDSVGNEFRFVLFFFYDVMLLGLECVAVPLAVD